MCFSPLFRFQDDDLIPSVDFFRGVFHSACHTFIIPLFCSTIFQRSASVDYHPVGRLGGQNGEDRKSGQISLAREYTGWIYTPGLEGGLS